MLAHFVDIIVQDDIEEWAPGATDELLAFLATVASSNSNSTARFRTQVRGLIFLLMALPMWQMK
jgi:hypothetical protein